MQDSKCICFKKHELTIFYVTGDGNSIPCHYCGKSSFSQEIYVDEIDREGQQLTRKSSVFRDVEKSFKVAMLSGRGMCCRKSKCISSFMTDQEKSFKKTFE